jgi:hypothetical protein
MTKAWPYQRACHLIADSLDELHKLKGKNLACFCPLDKPCHADTLLRTVNE